jgi:DNA-binding CsgD family transcriptional regulator
VDLDTSVGLRIRANEAESARPELERLLSERPGPEVRLALGLLAYLEADFTTSRSHLEAAFLEFQSLGARRRAALTASHLGQLNVLGLGNAVVAAGWNARALRLLADEECVERGWVSLALLGCSVPSIDQLTRDADLALQIAERFHDPELECRALGESGLAMVSQGRYAEGMSRLDEAMIMVHSGECDNQFVSGQVQCSFISACQRVGDIPRLEGWLSASAGQARGGAPLLLLTHCQIAYGSLLCLAGRWPEADSALRDSVDASRSRHANQQAASRSSLAELRIGQGRLASAAELLAGLDAAPEAQLAFTLLHHARGDEELAAATARSALRMYAGDAVHGSCLLSILVETEIARGNVPGACEAVAGLEEFARRTESRPVRARAALGRGRLASVEGRVDDAIEALEHGLHEVGNDWPLLGADLHLALAEAEVGRDSDTALAEARRALAVLGPIAAERRFAAIELLTRLGATQEAPGPRAGNALTGREREVLGLLGQGLSNPEIARWLVIAPKTAEHHVSAILHKLQLRSRSEAAVYAATLGRG